MNLSELNPHIRYARLHHARMENNREYSICYDCRLFFGENAQGYIVANGQKYNILNGTAIYLPPLTKYRFNFSNDKNLKIIIMDFDLVDDFADIKASLGTADENNFSPDKVIRYDICDSLSEPIVKSLPQIATTLRQCTEKFLLKEEYYRESSSALLKLCLIELIKNNFRKGGYKELCDDVSRYIYENYWDPNLTNAVIAEKFNYHSYHLNYIMKEETGKSLHRQLIDTRLNNAKNYLLTTSYSVEEVCWRCGFSSTSYFIKTFKDNTGTTPKKYRKIRFHTEL